RQGVFEISVSAPSAFQPHVCGLGDDQAALFQGQYVLSHRVFTHAHRAADGPVAGPALVCPAILAAAQVTVYRQLPSAESQLEHFVGHREVVVLCSHPPPPVCDSTHRMNASFGTTIRLPT
ncbi:DUF3796 domain-containing protein, partial [Dysosmobacter welbionis]